MKTKSCLGQTSRPDDGAGSPQPAAAWQKTARWGHRVLTTLFTSLFFAVCHSVQSQSYSIGWYKAAAGGGMSTGGVYVVNGTVGQADACSMSGGVYTLAGGFWSLVSVAQTPGAPLLTITHSGNSVTVSWPLASAGFALQQNNNLANPLPAGHPMAARSALTTA
jgi:hypothetical protein